MLVNIKHILRFWWSGKDKVVQNIPKMLDLRLKLDFILSFIKYIYIDVNIIMNLVATFHTPGGDVAEIFKPLGVSLGASIESRLSACSWLLHLGSIPNEAKGGRPYLVAKAVKA